MSRRLAILILCLGCHPTSAAAPAVVAEPVPQPAAPEPAASPVAEPELSAATVEPASPPPPDPAKPQVATVIVSSKLVRKSAFKEDATALFDVLPDFAFQWGGLEPIHDLDYVLLTTSDPSSRVAATVVVKHHLDQAELVAAVERAFSAAGETVAWSGRDGRKVGDPTPESADHDVRVVVLADKNFAAFTHPALLGKVDGWVDELKAFSRKHKLTALQADFDTSTYRGRTPPFPPPERVTASINASNRPTIRSALTFETTGAAGVFSAWFRDDLRRLIENNVTLRLTVARLFDEIVLRHEKRTVQLELRLDTSEAEAMLKMTAATVAKISGVTQAEAQHRADARVADWERRAEGKLPPSASVPPGPK